MIRCRKLSRTFGTREQPLHAVREVDLDIADGEFVSITGASGSGKSTLLHLIGSLDAPDGGEIEVAGLKLHEATEAEKTHFRRHDLGIVFQFFNLLPTLTVRENVMLPLTLRGDRRSQARELADRMLDLVGLSERRTHLSSKLSGGEMQRVAIARALAHEPRLVIADEPTGNLDSGNREIVLDILRSIHEQQIATLLVVTHENRVAFTATRRLQMEDGRLV